MFSNSIPTRDEIYAAEDSASHDNVRYESCFDLSGAYQLRTYGGSRSLKYACDGYGDLYLYGREFGADILIRAGSWETAYEIAQDECGQSVDPDWFGSEAELNLALEDGEAHYTSGGTLIHGEPHEWLVLVEDWNDQNPDEAVYPIFVPR